MKVIKSRFLVLSMAVLEVICAWLCFSFRVSFYFIDEVSFTGVTTAAFILFSLNVLLNLFLFLFGCDKFGDKLYRWLFAVNAFLLVAAAAVVIAFLLMGAEMIGDYLFYFSQAAPYVGVMCAVAVFVFVLPRFKGTFRVTIATVTAAATVIFSIGVYFDVTPFKLTCEPVVFISGRDTYNIVWATSHPATGVLKYTVDGEEHTVTDVSDGNIDCSSSIHSVTVRQEDFNGARYSVSSKHVIERTGYSVFYGKTVQSGSYTLNVPGSDSEGITIYSFSDWHEHPQYALESAEHMHEVSSPDLVIMLGDAVNMVNDEKQLAKYLLSPCAELTNSSVPTVFARGNHELRGPDAEQLKSLLGFESFYYTFDFYNFSAVVLDRGENHEDSYVEYWSLADYESYRQEQLQWLETVSYTDGKTCNILIAHDSTMATFCEERLEQMGTDLLLSGHLHETVCIAPGEIYDDEDELYTPKTYPQIIDGGKNGSDYAGTYIVLTKDGELTLEYIDRQGNSLGLNQFALSSGK